MIPFESVAIIGSGNVAYVYSKVLKNSGINLQYIYTRNQDKTSEVEKQFGVKKRHPFEKERCMLLSLQR